MWQSPLFQTNFRSQHLFFSLCYAPKAHRAKKKGKGNHLMRVGSIPGNTIYFSPAGGLALFNDRLLMPLGIAIETKGPTLATYLMWEEKVIHVTQNRGCTTPAALEVPPSLLHS